MSIVVAETGIARGVEFSLTVFGEAKPAGSKRGFVNKKTGKVVLSDANKNSRPWKDLISQEAGKLMSDRLLIDGPLEVTFTFYRKRPLGHSGARGLKPSAPRYPITKPDVLKLARAAEDAMTGIVYPDDAAIVDEHLFKRYGTPERIEIEIRRLG